MSIYSEFLSVAAKYLKGKENQLTMALIAAIAKGHLLLEDIPGMGKTTLVHLISKLLGLPLSRIQFTNDLLPADIIGTNIFDQKNGEFQFKKGPLFGELILADELNRATPKTQSALLQAMEEESVSFDGATYELPENFIVMATQNPRGQIGTYPLPESQIDRFFMSFSLGLPGREGEREILSGPNIRAEMALLKPLFKAQELTQLRERARAIELSDPLLDYALDLLEAARSKHIESILSPRAGKDLVYAAQIHALLHERTSVYPEDIQAVIGAVWAHRLGVISGVAKGERWAQELVRDVELP